MNAKTAERIAAARAAKNTRLYRLDLSKSAALLAGQADLTSVIAVSDRGGYGIAFRSADDEQAASAARSVLNLLGVSGRALLSTGLGVHRREVATLAGAGA